MGESRRDIPDPAVTIVVCVIQQDDSMVEDFKIRRKIERQATLTFSCLQPLLLGSPQSLFKLVALNERFGELRMIRTGNRMIEMRGSDGAREEAKCRRIQSPP